MRMAQTHPEPTVEFSFVDKPPVELEPEKSERNKTKGDIGLYFKINTLGLDHIVWVEFVVDFGPSWDNFNTLWLRKSDMQLAIYSPSESKWTSIFSTIEPGSNILLSNLSEPTGQEQLLLDMRNTSANPIFTIIGFLDADGDGYYNSRDAFPFDPAARDDRDSDGSPGNNEWVHGKSEKDSTTGLHQDAFPDDPAASIDTDSDRCPDEWNPGKSQANSTSKPKLDLDSFPTNPGACLDTDGDGWPDILIVKKNNQLGLIEDTDDDNDGIPDWWEEQWIEYAEKHNLTNRLNPKNDSDASEDWDGDGRTNLVEYQKDTNPYVKEKKEEADLMTTSGLWIIIVVIIVLLLILIVFMYTKMRREQLLENKVRVDIINYISNNPGTHYRKISNELDIKFGSLTHHLNMLEQQHYIKSLQDGMYRRFYPVNTPIKTGLILSEVQESILKLIRSEPGISQVGIARELDLARKVVNYHIKILSDAGFVNVETSGRSSQLYYLNGLDFNGKRKGGPPRRRGKRSQAS
jgi:predicted transcriptional regulator